MTKSITRIAAAAACLAAGACAAEKKTATAHGTVTLGGKPVTNGVIVFASEADPSVTGSGQIRGDGKYTVLDAPRGPVKVYFNMEAAKAAAEAEKKQGSSGRKPGNLPIGGRDAVPPGPYVPVPEKYESAATTDLRYEVTGDSNEIDVVVGG